MIVDARQFVDVEEWCKKLLTLSRRVCVVEVRWPSGRVHRGTGFLISRDAVLTSGHLFYLECNPVTLHETVTISFDRTLRAGSITDKGGNYTVAAHSLFISPNLDYAVLRADGRPGEEEVDVHDNSLPQPRGWMSLFQNRKDRSPGSNDDLFTFQYVWGRKLQLAFCSGAIISYDPSKGQIRYRINTSSGSSGAPCFDRDLELVAIHTGHQDGANYGIPMRCVESDIRRAGLHELLSSGSNDLVDSGAHLEPIRSREHAEPKYSELPPRLLAMLRNGESQTVSFVGFLQPKHTEDRVQNANRRNFVKLVASFINAKHGGTIVLGMSPLGEILGVEGSYNSSGRDVAGWQGYGCAVVKTLCMMLQTTNPSQYFSLSRFLLDGHDLWELTIKSASAPVYVKDRFYYRSNGQTIELRGPHLIEFLRRTQDQLTEMSSTKWMIDDNMCE